VGVISNLMYAVGFKINSSPINDAEKKIGGLTKGVVGLGAVAASVGIAAVAAIGAIGVAAVNSSSEFERSMSRIQQSTGATTGMMEETRGMAKDLYNQNLGEDWNDLGNALTVTSKLTKLTGEELKGATKNALEMRNIFGFDIPETVKTSNSLVKNFGISSSESFNLLAQGAQRITDNPEFLDTVNEYSVHFRALGFTANEVMDTLGAGFDAGALNIDKVGDAVKEFTIRSKDMSKTSGDAYKMLGLDSDKMFSTFAKGGPAAQKAFKTVLQMISDVEDPVARNTIGVALMGSQFEDLEAPVIEAMGTVKSEFDMTKDTMNEMNKIKFKSIGDAMKMFGRQVETGFLIPLGDKILPYLDKFGKWLTDNEPTIKKYGEMIADKFGAGLSMAANEVEYFLKNIEKFTPFIAAAIGPGAAIITGFAYLFKNDVNGMATGAGESWNKIKTFFDSFMEKVNIVMPYIMTAIGIVMPIIKSMFLSNLTIVWSVVKFVFDFLVASITSAMNIAWAVFSFAWNNITGVIQIFKSLITGDFAGAWEAFKTTISGAIDGAGKIFDAFVNGAKNIGTNFIDGLITGFKAMVPALGDVVKSIGDGALKTFTDFFKIKSPSKVMMEVGGFVGEGLALGIDHTGGMVNQASTGIADQAFLPYQDTESEPVLAPATAASVTNNTYQAPQGSAPVINAVFNFEITGNASDSPMAKDMVNQFKKAMQEVIESASRRQGLEASPS
jgi:phage-related minor tail protein